MLERDASSRVHGELLPALRARHESETNRVGYHGGALLSPHVLARPSLVRLERSGRWFGPERGERRVGGRIAVIATPLVGGVGGVLASVHLENHCDPAERAAQLGRLIDAIERHAPGAPVLIGGDLKTSSLGLRELEDRDALADALRRGSLRLDWFLSRGLRLSAPQVLAAVDPQSGDALSDHEAIAVVISPQSDPSSSSSIT